MLYVRNGVMRVRPFRAHRGAVALRAEVDDVSVAAGVQACDARGRGDVTVIGARGRGDERRYEEEVREHF